MTNLWFKTSVEINGDMNMVALYYPHQIYTTKNLGFAIEQLLEAWKSLPVRKKVEELLETIKTEMDKVTFK